MVVLVVLLWSGGYDISTAVTTVVAVTITVSGAAVEVVRRLGGEPGRPQG
jgi:hypothetical protein